MTDSISQAAVQYARTELESVEIRRVRHLS